MSGADAWISRNISSVHIRLKVYLIKPMVDARFGFAKTAALTNVVRDHVAYQHSHGDLDGSVEAFTVRTVWLMSFAQEQSLTQRAE